MQLKSKGEKYQSKSVCYTIRIAESNINTQKYQIVENRKM